MIKNCVYILKNTEIHTCFCHFSVIVTYIIASTMCLFFQVFLGGGNLSQTMFFIFWLFCNASVYSIMQHPKAASNFNSVFMDF